MIDEEVHIVVNNKTSSIDEGLAQIIESDRYNVSMDEASSKIISFQNEVTSDSLVEIQFVFFDGSQVMYLEWLKVQEELRGEGISRQVRREFIDSFANRYDIYTNIKSPKLITVAIDQGFRQIEQGELEGLYVRFHS